MALSVAGSWSKNRSKGSYWDSHHLVCVSCGAVGPCGVGVGLALDADSGIDGVNELPFSLSFPFSFPFSSSLPSTVTLAVRLVSLGSVGFPECEFRDQQLAELYVHALLVP